MVEAYWIGNPLLDRVGPALVGNLLDDRFRRRVGRAWPHLVAAVPHGARPHHSFHVLGVYPFVGLLRGGEVDEPLRVLDSCRIRWGRVVAAGDREAVVRSRRLEYDGRRLALGPPHEEIATTGEGGLHLTRPLRSGDWCALHWDWVCDRLTDLQVRALRHYTATQLAAVNDAPASVLA